MKFIVRLLDTEIIAIEFARTPADAQQDGESSGMSRTFGFHGGSGGHAERAAPYEPPDR